jgi:hypothetical protein
MRYQFPHIVLSESFMNLYLEFSNTSARVRLDEARRDLIALMVSETRARRDVNDLRERISEFEGYVKDALNIGDESLAQEIAEKIAAMQSRVMLQEKSNVSFSAQVVRLKDAIRRLEGHFYDTGNRLQYILDCLDAAAELEEGGEYLGLERKMRAAGIGKHINTGREVLERIRATR